MGDSNDEIKTLMKRFEDKGENRGFAKYINVFFVRRIFLKLSSPIGYHSSMGFTGDQLSPLCGKLLQSLRVRAQS